MTHDTDTVQDWLVSNRLYEVHIFYYTLIVVFWVMMGLLGFGFEIDGFNCIQNLLINFICYLAICLLMVISFVIFFNVYESKKYEIYLKNIKNDIENNLTDDEKEIVWDLIEEQGHILPTNKQRFAILFLGCYFLFEIFFVSAWIKDMTMVWQPDWAMAVVEWVKENTKLISISEGGKFFSFSILLSGNDFLYQYYQDKSVFLNSELGKSAMFFVFLKFLSALPILGALYIVISKILGWIGINHLISRASSSIWGFIWTSTLMMFGLLLAFIFLFF